MRLSAALVAAGVVMTSAPVPALGATTAHVHLTGRLQVVARDTAHGDVYDVELLTSSGAYQLHGNRARWPRTGTTVAADGSATGRAMTVSAMTAVAPASSPPTSGTMTALVIPVDWSGTLPSSPTPAQLKTDVIDMTGSWFQTASHGHIAGMTGDVTPWQSIPAPNGCDNDAIQTAAVAAAKSAGYNPAAYQHVIAYFPDFAACSYGGLGDVGGPRVWLNGYSTTSIVAHELGHNLGLSHAHSLTCADNGVRVTESATCDPYDEYGDPSDTMGSGDATEYDAAQQARLGWLAPQVTEPCATGISLAPYESSSSGAVRGVQIPGGVGGNGQSRSYWLEYRQPTGVDAALATGLTDGVLVHLDQPMFDPDGKLDVGPKLLDGNPASGSGMAEAAVPVNTSASTLSGTTVSVTAATATGATVDLTTDRPSSPRTATVSVVSGAPQVSWQSPVCRAGDVVTYDVAASGSAPVSVAGSATSAKLDAALLSADHTYTVTAHDAANHSGIGAVAPATAPRLGALSAIDSAMHIEYEPSVSNGGQAIDRYVITAAPSDGGDPVLNYVVPVTGKKTINQGGLTNGTTYSVTIAALLHDGTLGPATEPVTITPSPFRVVFASPAAGSTTPNHATVSWSYNRAATWGPYCDLDGHYVDCTARTSVALTGLASGSHVFHVHAADDFGDDKGALTWAVDGRAPTVSMSAVPTVSMGKTVALAWTGSDATGTGITGFDVRQRNAAWSAELGSSWSNVVVGTSTTKRSVSVGPGRTYCFSVRARNGLGNASAWSAERCTTTPLDDRSLTASSGWSRIPGSGYYLGTANRSKTASTKLVRTGVHAAHLALVVTRCPTCGTIAVYLDKGLLKSFSLHTSSTRNKVLVQVPLPARLRGRTITVKVTSRNKPVIIDALVARLT